MPNTPFFSRIKKDRQIVENQWNAFIDANYINYQLSTIKGYANNDEPLDNAQHAMKVLIENGYTPFSVAKQCGVKLNTLTALF